MSLRNFPGNLMFHFFQSLTVHNFNLGGGTDLTGVPTKMLTLNCSFKMTVHNPATFFGIHVSSESVNLMYSEITVATGEVRIVRPFDLEGLVCAEQNGKCVYVNH